MASIPQVQGSDRQLRKRPQRDADTPEPRTRKRARVSPNSGTDVTSAQQSKQGAAKINNGTVAKTASQIRSNTEEIAEEHLCPICHLLLYRPVKTKCQHRLCRTCMEHWAEVSAAGLVIMDLDEAMIASLPNKPGMLSTASAHSADTLEARCPMCRMQTSAEPDIEYADILASTYPHTWARRRAEENDSSDHGARSLIQNLTLYIGNRHTMVNKADKLVHEWVFFVRPSRTDIIEEVQIQLYPSLRRSGIILQRAPYEIRRTGEDYDTVAAYIILKAGFRWVSDEACDSPDGETKGMLPLGWTLNFTGSGGKGSMGRCVLKVKNDREWNGGSSEAEQDRREWDRLVRAYQRDGRYEPPEEDD